MPRGAKDYLMLPWHIRGPVAVIDASGTVTRYEMTVGQLPGFAATGPTDSAVLYAFKRELLKYLEGMIRRGEEIPAPAGAPVAYVAVGRRAHGGRINRLRIHTATPIVTPSIKL